MSQDELFINGELLRLRREERGWVLNDMATRACMSVKQIRQLEEGGISAFYSVAVKVTAAKKVATLLGLSADEVFVKASAPEAEMPVHDLEASEHVIASEEVAIPVQEIASHDTVEAVTPTPSEVTAVVSVDVASTDAAPKSKTSLLTIAGLFTVALAAAAYLQPKEEPAAETVPPVQVLPSDVADPASAAASGSEPVASGVAEAPASVPATTAKPVPAATAASVSVAPVVAASVPRVAAPVASASMVTRPASAAVAVPATSAASKAP